MYKVAVLVHGGNIDVRKGLLNACISRIEYLSKLNEYDITAYYLRFEKIEFTINNFILKKWKYKKRKLNDCEFNILWHVEYYSKNKQLNRFLNVINRLFKLGYWDKGWISKFVPKFKNYDFLSVHSRECAYIAQKVKEKYSVPFFTTWHGSDIHTIPYVFPFEKPYIVSAINSADCNFFVSNALKLKAEELTVKANKEVLYNGVDEIFKKYDDIKRRQLRKKNDVEKCKVVSFAGTLRDIKNADILPDIFEKVRSLYRDDIVFWIIGDGELRQDIEKKITKYNLNCRMWGNKPVTVMPDLLNCTDLLILPSKHEGFGLVAIEALKCGANVVASAVGGIPEVIDVDYCVELGDNFIDRFAEKVVDVLTSHPIQTFDREKFNWSHIAKIESDIYKSYLNK